MKTWVSMLCAMSAWSCAEAPVELLAPRGGAVDAAVPARADAMSSAADAMASTPDAAAPDAAAPDAAAPDAGPLACATEVACFAERGLPACVSSTPRWDCAAGVCAPRCEGQCGSRCDCLTGLCVAGTCVAAAGSRPCPSCSEFTPGAACEIAWYCDTLCLTPAMGFPDGFQTKACTLDTDCGDAPAHCEPRPEGGLCVQGCGSTTDCRPGYTCAPLVPGGRPACWPAP